jgi:hypothetical protein
LLSSIVSGVSADLWPGTGFDRRRFVETWVRYSGQSSAEVLISVPLLVRRLKKNNRLAEATKIQAMRPKMFGPGFDTKILVGDEVDAPEAEVLLAASSLTAKDVRDRAYPTVFYEHVRSTLVHEYHLDSRSASVPMTARPVSVSYVNRADPNKQVVQRRIHFHLPWLIEMVRSIATNAISDPTPRPLAKPKKWWIEG